MEYCKGNVHINEKSPSAKVKEIIWTGSDFHKVDSTVVKDMTSFFQMAGSPEIFNLDCDGIILFEKDSQKYIFFSELKSTFDTSDIFYAKDQIISSYLKINMIMHLLHCYNYNDFIVKGFIACLSPNMSFLRDLYKEQLLKSGSRYKSDADFAIDLCYFSKRSTVLQPTDCFKLKDLPLGNTGIFKTMEFHYIEVPIGKSSVTVDVNAYI